MAAPKTVLTYPLNGTLKDFDIPFEYLARKFVVVTLIGTTRRVLVLNSEYRFTGKKQITTTTAWGPAQGFENIEIRRVTSATERLVDFSDGSILRAYDLNTAQVQSLHIAEEARDLTADTIGVNNDGDLDARGRRIVNLADATQPGHAVTLRQEQEWAASTLGNKDASESAREGAEAAQRATQSFRDAAGNYAVNSDNSARASQASRLASEEARDISTAKSVIATDKAGIAMDQAGIAKAKAVESADSSAASKDWSSKAKADADRAQGYAAGLNLPSASGNAKKYLRQNSTATGLEYVLAPAQVVFQGTNGATAHVVNAGNCIFWNDAAVNIGGFTLVSNNRQVVIPVTGTYKVSVVGVAERGDPGAGGTAGVEFRLGKNTLGPVRNASLGWSYFDTVGFATLSLTRLVVLTAGDSVSVYLASNSRIGVDSISGPSAFLTIELLAVMPN